MTEPIPRPDPFRDREPPAALERRVRDSLRASGVLASGRARFARRAVSSAGIIAAVVAAFVLGRITVQRDGAGADPRQHYLLLLYEGAGYRDDRPTRDIVAEYGAWADSLRRAGRLVLGEKLAATHRTLPASARPVTPSDVPTGLFIVRASDSRDASTLTSTSPHLRYGGHILTSAIER